MDFKEAEHFFIYGISIVDSYYEKNEPHASYAPWNEDNLFLATYRTIKQNTLVDKYRCFELWSIIEQVSNLNGALIEIGVWRGGTGALIATKAKLCDIEDTVYLCDTFTGVVKAGSNDSFYIGGEHKDTSIESVESLLGEMSLENAQILKGIFPDDTADLINEEVFRFCHIDVDVYNSAQQIFDWIWGKMVVGGIIVYDDYGFSKCDGITKHVNQLKTRSDLIYIHNLNGHALFIKIS
ncbi:methyltransferase [Cohnella sp. CIP 111063]|nr:methyltransferase [Cohnella sp. CIP 111063]